MSNHTKGASSDEEEKTENADTGSGLSRRSVLKTSSTAAVGTAGLGAVSGTASAESTTGEDDEIELGLFECVEDGLRIDVSKTVELDPWWWKGDYDENFDVSDLDDEVCLFIHGFEAEAFVEEQTTLLKNSVNADSHPYSFDGDFVGVKWPSTDINYTGPWDRAAEYGEKLADWLTDVLWAEDPTTDVHIAGHSLGGRAAFNVLNGLEEKSSFNNEDRLKNVVALGPADMVRFVCDHNETGKRIYNYYDGINEIPDDVYVFYSSDDFAVGSAHELWGDLFWYTPDGEGLGAEGPTCGPQPNNLHGVDVSASVQNHCEYYKSDGNPEKLARAVTGQL